MAPELRSKGRGPKPGEASGPAEPTRWSDPANYADPWDRGTWPAEDPTLNAGPPTRAEVCKFCFAAVCATLLYACVLRCLNVL